MNRLYTLLAALAVTCAMCAQPKWTAKAAKSVFTLKTFSADGTLIGSSSGFFINEQGDAISNFAPFKGAAKAIVIDANGKEMPVEAIMGVNDLYDVAKFHVTCDKRVAPLPFANAPAAVGANAWLLPYSVSKKPEVMAAKIEKSEKVQEIFDYYTVTVTIDENMTSSPLLNDNGEVIGMMQKPVQANAATNYAISARFADSLKITAITMNDATYRSTSIKKALPDNPNDAIVALYINTTMDSLEYVTLIEDFIRKFPNMAEGYIYRAQQELGGKLFDEADKDMRQALSVSDKKDDTYYNYAKLIYNKDIYFGDVPYEAWNLDKAHELIDKAIAENPLPAYQELKANIYFAQRKYEEAYNVYMALAQTSLHNAETFYSASRCKELLGDTVAYVALLDSAVATFPRPYTSQAAPYLLARANAYEAIGKYRAAVSDYNEYEELMRYSLNAQFYDIRHQVEIKARLFQQALNDIAKCIEIEPQNTYFYAEKASLEIRVGLNDDAIKTAQALLDIEKDNSDGYLFLGLAQCQKGDKVTGAKNLQKAKELGDPQAEQLIEKFAR